MGWRVMSEARDRRDGYGERDHHMKKRLKEMAEDFIDEICEEMEGSYGERNDMDNYDRNGYGERDGYGERRGVRGTGRYSRMR